MSTLSTETLDSFLVCYAISFIHSSIYPFIYPQTSWLACWLGF